MSTLSGNATKGEKGKKFQRLMINLCSTNKPSEPEQQQQQQKSNIQRKQHGMTSLGKVPVTRRPTNLPSEKSEHSGNEPSTNLVPSGGAGWGNKSNETGPIITPSVVQNTNSSTSVPVNNVVMTGTSPQVPLAQHYLPTSRMPQMTSMGGHVPVHHGHTDVKTWAIMAHGGDSSAPNFLTPQSPLFQHEFPSLSSNSENASSTTTVTTTAIQKPTASITADTQYGPAPSLRPQTEGSWIHGGSRLQGLIGPGVGNQSATAPALVRRMVSYLPALGPNGAQNNLDHSGGAAAPAGPYPVIMPQQPTLPPQFNGMMPPFMLRNYPPDNFPPPNFQGTMKGAVSRALHGSIIPLPGTSDLSRKRFNEEDMKIRPIIKEEDLNQMASISKDIGWAGHEDMDYNQKLKFSDDEDDEKGRDSRNKTRTKIQRGIKGNDKTTEKKDSVETENDLRCSKESLKDQDKLYSVDTRNSLKNAWQMRRTIISAPVPTAPRYQIPSNGRFEEDDETWQEKARQKKEEMEVIIQRAKVRREEEEKRFLEQQQAAAEKLRKLEAEMFANSNTKEYKGGTSNERGNDMLPQWEKEKYQPQNANDDDAKKTQNVTPIPVVKDASEFRELTQLVDRNTFVKKDVRERESIQQGGFSRGYSGNIAPRFQNTNLQNSNGYSSSSSTAPTRSIVSQTSQFSSKFVNLNYTSSRFVQRDCDSQSEKDINWSVDDAHKDRNIERYSKESSQERDYVNYEDDRKYNKEVDRKSEYGNEKDEYSNDSCSRELDQETSRKVEYKNGESDRDKIKIYDISRYSESENQEKKERKRVYEDSEKSRHCNNSLSRASHNFSDSENNERKRSLEEIIYENVKSYNAGKDYYRKSDSSVREKSDVVHSEIGKERSRESSFIELNKEVGAKRGYEMELKKDKETYKNQERKSPCTYDGRLRENRLKRDSRESLREEPYIIQEARSYSWADDSDMDDRRMRKDHYKEDRSDRYSYAQRAPPKPITREKLEAKELEFDSKGNLTALGRSDRKTATKKVESGETKEKGKENRLMKTDSKSTSNEQKLDSQAETPCAWKKDDKKHNDEFKTNQSFGGTDDQYLDKNESTKGKEEKKDSAGKPSSKNVQGDKSAGEKHAVDRRKIDRCAKESSRSWSKAIVYHGSSYRGGRKEPKARRSSRGTSIKGRCRDSKYSESEYSDEIGGSGREEGSTRNDREKGRLSKPKRYHRDYRIYERDYRNSRGRNNQDYYFTKLPPRNRNNEFRNSGGSNVGKRVDGYGPPSTKNPFSGHISDDKRQKYSRKDNSSTNEQTATEKKNENGSSNKPSARTTSAGDRNWKKNIESQQTTDNKSTVSSLTSMQIAEANDELYATAVEGSDSEESAHVHKPKTVSSSKRTMTVVATKASRKPFRSTSRKRYENRRIGPFYSRKDSGTYLTGAKRVPPSNGAKNSASNKENEKYSDDVTRSSTSDFKMPEKSTKDYVEVQSKKNLKLRNRSNSRKNVRNTGLVNSRKSFQEAPAPLQSKSKVADGKSTESKDSKCSESISSHFRELGLPIPALPPASNAWDKPLTGALRTGSPSTQRLVGDSAVSNASGASTSATEKSSLQIPDRRESPALVIDTGVTLGITEKVTAKVLDNLDGTTPPVQTIIFENRNFKPGPPDVSSKTKYNSQMKNHRLDKDSKLEGLESNVHSFGKDTSNTELSMTLFNKNEDCADMKLDFAFDSSDFSRLTDDNKSRKVVELSHAMHVMQASTDADLNLKIASVKKVWDGSLAEHYGDKYNMNMVNSANSFSPSFGSHASDPNSGSCFSLVDSSGHVQVDDVGGLGQAEVIFSPVSQIQNVSSAYGSSQAVLMKNDNACSNVCKVKPQPQGSCANIVNVAQSSVISTSLVSQPPPMSSPSYTFSCSTQQANLSNGTVAASPLSINYAGAQYNVSPVPSSPVLFNTTPTPNAAASLYQAFQIDNQVAGRTPFGQYPSFNISSCLGQTSAMNQHSLYVQPPPNPAQSDIYSQQLHPFRMQPQNAFGNNQQITTPNTTMLSNSLMTAAVKQTSTIGSKSAGYQTAPPASQIFMLDPTTQLFNPNFVPGNHMIQRSHSNVAASLTAPTSFYNSGTAQTGYFPGTSSTMPPQTGTAIGLATAYNTQSGTQSLGIQNYNLTHQFKSTQNYMKSCGNISNLTADFGTNKSTTISNQHDVLNTVYQSNSQLANKQKLQQGNKNAQPVHQQVSQYSMNQNVYAYSAPNPMRNNGSANKGSQYPHPIQRPPSQGNNPNRNNGAGSNVSNASSAHSHRMSVRNNSHQLMNNIQQPPCSVYYSTSSGYSSSKHEASSVDSKNESNADANLAESIKSLNVKHVSAPSDKSASSNE